MTMTGLYSLIPTPIPVLSHSHLLLPKGPSSFLYQVLQEDRDRAERPAISEAAESGLRLLGESIRSIFSERSGDWDFLWAFVPVGPHCPQDKERGPSDGWPSTLGLGELDDAWGKVWEHERVMEPGVLLMSQACRGGMGLSWLWHFLLSMLLFLRGKGGGPRL